ncbi:MAG: ribonuclease III [Candidatus Doudnabacteria bacterium]|nr:ribonuclease III [Candidatus Doudnabacteria bacterium]MCA9387692.1 ribonuclease III [Candidatus Andersenbacteria bacterium]
MDKDLSALMEALGVQFADINHLRQAMVHRSYLNEHKSFPLDQNERLEFLGDAVLELVVTDHLYRTFPNPEGELTAWRSALVNSNMLSKHGEALGFDEHLYLSKGEARSTGKARNAILANAYEAVIGAIYIDQGYEVAADFITRDLLPEVPNVLERREEIDPKSSFQETVQEQLNVTPQYRVIDESGPDHNRHFVMGVYIENILVATGEGSSKQSSQVAAARTALQEDAWKTAYAAAGGKGLPQA